VLRSDRMPRRSRRTVDCATRKYRSRGRLRVRGPQSRRLPRRLSATSPLLGRRVYQIVGRLQASPLVDPHRPDPDFVQLHDRPIYSVPLRVNSCTAARLYADVFIFRCSDFLSSDYVFLYEYCHCDSRNDLYCVEWDVKL